MSALLGRPFVVAALPPYWPRRQSTTPFVKIDMIAVVKQKSEGHRITIRQPAGPGKEGEAMTKRLIPERTVDSLLAAEVILALPEALIWSPSNTAGMWDHAVLSQFGRLIVFECKGVVSNAAREPAAPWRVPIDVPQLDAYVASGVTITYLLVFRPGDLRVPWRRFCNLVVLGVEAKPGDSLVVEQLPRRMITEDDQ